MPGCWWIRYSKRLHIHKQSVSWIAYTALPASLLTPLDIGLQVLDNVIMTKWKVLPREQCQGQSYREGGGWEFGDTRAHGSSRNTQLRRQLHYSKLKLGRKPSVSTDFPE